MIQQTLTPLVVVIYIFFCAGQVLSADQETDMKAVQVQTQEQSQVYGSQLMTEDERVAYRAKMRTANTEEERERIRNEHHELMQERAAAQGVTLPENPPTGRGGGTGSGKGAMGSGGGGKGQGRNR